MIGVTITIPGDPSGARINTARRAAVIKHGQHRGKPTTFAAPKAVQWRNAAVLAVRAAWAANGSGTIALGVVAVEVFTFWPRRRRSGPASGQPLGDVDATAKAVLDVLEAAGVLGDDGQVWRLILEAHYDKDNPRIEVRILPTMARATTSTEVRL